jgi:hypothetical protein
MSRHNRSGRRDHHDFGVNSVALAGRERVEKVVRRPEGGHAAHVTAAVDLT